jgi:hypothetical protein
MQVNLVPLIVSLYEYNVRGIAYIYELYEFVFGSFEPVRFWSVYFSGYLFRGISDGVG